MPVHITAHEDRIYSIAELDQFLSRISFAKHSDVTLELIGKSIRCDFVGWDLKSITIISPTKNKKYFTRRVTRAYKKFLFSNQPDFLMQFVHGFANPVSLWKIFLLSCDLRSSRAFQMHMHHQEKDQDMPSEGKTINFQKIQFNDLSLKIFDRHYRNPFFLFLTNLLLIGRNLRSLAFYFFKVSHH